MTNNGHLQELLQREKKETYRSPVFSQWFSFSHLFPRTGRSLFNGDDIGFRPHLLTVDAMDPIFCDRGKA